MTLCTSVLIRSEGLHEEDVFQRCRDLIGANEYDQHIPIIRWPGTLRHKGGQGLPAHLVLYTDPAASNLQDTDRTMMIRLDTAYGYHENGEDCYQLHARLVKELGLWLDHFDGGEVYIQMWGWHHESSNEWVFGSDKISLLEVLASGKDFHRG